MTTILFLAFVVFATYCCIWLRRVARHDRVLFPFCQLRRDIMRFLREHMPKEANALSREEYRSILRLVAVVGVTIHHYNQHKTLMFNLREIERYLNEYRATLKETPINLTDNAEIQELHARFVRCLAEAFLAYTPMIRSERALRVLVWAYRTTSARLSRDVVEIAEQIRAAARGEVSRLAT